MWRCGERDEDVKGGRLTDVVANVPGPLLGRGGDAGGNLFALDLLEGAARNAAQSLLGVRSGRKPALVVLSGRVGVDIRAVLATGVCETLALAVSLRVGVQAVATVGDVRVLAHLVDRTDELNAVGCRTREHAQLDRWSR